MNIEILLNKQTTKERLSKKELEFIVTNYVNSNIDDKTMTIFLKNICKYGLSKEETIDLTNIMLSSGESIDLSDISGIKVDKHSTGGVGDKVSLVALPIAAAVGVKVAKMSGAALGFTGGTVDKLESIPGFNVNLTEEEFINQINDINIAVFAQTKNLVPADKKIYALRDITNTAESIPLIASSIMSKKLASGSDKIVLDIKVGEGALIKNIEEARKLADLMIEIGENNNKETRAILTNMESPLGFAIGNSLEVKEAMKTLLNNGEEEFTKLCIEIASHMVSLGKNISIEEAKEKVITSIKDKSAYNKFLELIKHQGGNIEKLQKAEHKIELYSKEEGYIEEISAAGLGRYVMKLGAGRVNKEDKIDYTVGIILNKKVGEYTKKGELLLTVHSSKKEIQETYNLFKFNKEKPAKKNIILEVIKK